MSFTAKDVQSLREKTGCGMMDCKKALTESNGDIEKAIEHLREKGLAAAAKKSSRIAAEGVVISISDNEKKVGVVLEINAETDFVSKNAEFTNFVNNIALTILKQNPTDLEELYKCKLSGSENSVTVEEALKEKIFTIGENIKIRRFKRIEGITASYIHGNGRIAVLVEIRTDVSPENLQFKEFGKSIAMQIAASAPQFIDRSVVPSNVIDKEKEILLAQAINEGKSKEIASKMVEGRILKYFKDICLVDQPFIKDMDKTVAQYIEQVSNEISSELEIASFVRFEKGEGLEKREDNFADEVSNMIN